jgi:hypothetical protein
VERVRVWRGEVKGVVEGGGGDVQFEYFFFLRWV